MTHEPYVKIRLANHSCFVVVLVRLGAAAAVAPEWLRSDHGAVRERVEPARLGGRRWFGAATDRPLHHPRPGGIYNAVLRSDLWALPVLGTGHRLGIQKCACGRTLTDHRSQTNTHDVWEGKQTRHSRGVRVLPEPRSSYRRERFIRRELPPKLPPKAKLRTSGAPLGTPRL